MTIHIKEHGVGMGAEATSAGSMAITMQAAKGGLVLMASTVGQFGYIVFGLGMAGRFSSMNFHKMAPLIVAVLSLFGLITVIIAEHAHDLIDTVVTFSLVVLLVNLHYLATIGWGLYRGVAGYAREE